MVDKVLAYACCGYSITQEAGRLTGDCSDYRSIAPIVFLAGKRTRLRRLFSILIPYHEWRGELGYDQWLMTPDQFYRSSLVLV